MTDEELREQVYKDQQAGNTGTFVTRTDKDGNEVETLPFSEAKKQWGITNSSLSSSESVPYYIDDSGKISVKQSAVKSTISFDEKTGDINIVAPEQARNNEYYQSLKERLGTYSGNYKLNKDWKVPVTDAEGKETGETQTLKEYVEKLNTPQEGQEKSQFQQIIDVSLMMENEKAKYGEMYRQIDDEGNIKPIEFTNEDLTTRFTVALPSYVDKVTDTTLQSVPQWFYDKYLQGNVTTYDSDTGVVQYKDLMSNWYDRTKTDTQERVSAFIELGRWLENARRTPRSSDENKAEYMKAEALYEFLYQTDPTCHFWNGVADIGLGAPLKAGTAIVGGLGEGLGTAVTWVAEKNVQFIDFVNSKLTGAEYHNIQFVPQVREELDNAKETMIKWAQYAGTGDFGFAAQSLTDPKYADSLVAMTTMDYNESKAYTAVSGVMQFIGNMALLISVGDAVATKATGALSRIAGNLATNAAGLAGDEIATAWGLENMATVTSGTAKLISSLIGTENTVSLLGTAVTALNSGVTMTTASLIGETLGEAIVGDPVQLAEILASDDTPSETKEYLWQTFLGNAFGRGGEKFFMTVGETTVGRAVSSNWRRTAYKVQTGVSDIIEAIRMKLSKYGDLSGRIAHLEEVAGNLPQGSRQAVGKANKAQIMRQKQLLNNIKKEIASSDKIKWIGRDQEEILEAVEKAEAKLATLTSIENDLDDFINLVRAQKNVFRDSDLYPTFRDVNKTVAQTHETLLKAERKAGMKSAGYDNAGALMSNETNQYINTVIHRQIVANAKASGAVSDVKALDKQLDHYDNLIKNYVKNTDSEVVTAANELAGNIKTWYQEFNRVKLDVGVVDEVWLQDKQDSKIWGEGGKDYARVQRKQETNKYLSIRTKPGADTEKLYEELGHYSWGSTDEFVDPILVMEMELTNASELVVRNRIVSNYNKLTGTATVLKTAEEVRLAQDGKKMLKQYIDQARAQTAGVAENFKIKDVFSRIASYRKNLDDASQDQLKASGIANKGFKINKPNTGQAKAVINVLADNSIEDFSLNDLFTVVYERGAAVEVTGNFLIVNRRIVTGNELAPEVQRKLTGWVKENINDLYDRGLISSRSLDEGNLQFLMKQPDFDMNLKRFICVNDPKCLSSKAVADTWTEVAAPMLYEQYWDDMERRYVEHLESAAKSSIAAGMDKDAIRDTSYEIFESFKDTMRNDQSGKQLLKRMVDVYGKENPDEVADFVLAAGLRDSKQELQEQVFKMSKEEFKNLGYDGDTAEKLANETKRLVGSMVEKNFDDARVKLAELDNTAKQLVDVDNWHKDIYDAATDLGATLEPRNVLLIPGDNGALEAVRIDPLLAEFVTTKVPNRAKMTLVESINSLWMKLWRLGATGGATGRSISNQYMRDMGNAWIMGNVTHLMGTSEQILAEVFGSSAAHYLSQYSADAQQRFMAEAAERAAKTGETQDEALGNILAASEKKLGQLTVATASETETFKIMRETRGAFAADGTKNDVDGFTKMSEALNKFADKLNKVHNVRENYLRNVVYMNNLNKALGRNMSLENARSYALYVSNNATTNFARGTTFMTSLINTVPYLRAAINGTKSFWRLWALDPVGVTNRIIGGIFVPAIGLLTYSLMDEENAKVYKNFKQYEKEDSLCFVIGGYAMSIPLPQEIAPFVAPIRQAIEAMAGQDRNALWELAASDLIGLSPIDLSGFVDLDGYRMFGSDGSWLSRMGLGIGRTFSQIAPRWATAMATAITGRDLFTGKQINVNDVTIDPVTKDVVPLDYTSGTFAKTLQKLFPSLSSNIAQEVLEYVGGTAGTQMLDWLAELGLGLLGQQSIGDSLTNILQGGVEGVTAPFIMNTYDLTQSAWNNAISRLYTMKNDIFNTRAWSDYEEMYNKASTPEEMQAAAAVRDNLLKPFYDEVRTTIDNLRKNYGQGLSQAKYASIISLMNLQVSNQGAGNSYADNLNQELYNTGRAAALATMERLGFPSASTSSDDHWFVTYRVNSKGNITATYNSPIEILNMEAAVKQAPKIQQTDLDNIISEKIGYDMRAKMYNDRSAAMDKKDYDKANDVVMAYNNKVLTAIDPYIRKYGPEAFINNDSIMNYLANWIIVPSDWETDNRNRWISAKKLNKQDGFIKSYLKYIYGVE